MKGGHVCMYFDLITNIVCCYVTQSRKNWPRVGFLFVCPTAARVLLVSIDCVGAGDYSVVEHELKIQGKIQGWDSGTNLETFKNYFVFILSFK